MIQSVSPPVPALSRAELRRAFAKILFLIFFAVIAPVPILAALGYGSVGSFVGLAGVGAVVAVLAVDFRIALLATVGAGMAAALLILASVTWWSAAVVMSLVALVFGLSARRGWQNGFVAFAVALSYIASDGANTLEPLTRAAALFGIAIIVWGLIAALITHLFFRRPVLPSKPQSSRTVLGYVAMLTVVTFITQSLAIGLNLGHAGGWLVMTPFLVILPQIHDGFRKSFRRAAGTIVGFFIVIGLSTITTSHVILSVAGALMLTAAMYAKFKNWNYFFFALFLTPGIVILEGLSTSVTTEAEYRLEATIGAIAISLAAMGIAKFIGRKLPPEVDHSSANTKTREAQSD
jgi:hypothetical protein